MSWLRYQKLLYSYKSSNSIIRYLCLALISTVVICILFLIRMSWVSAKQVGESIIPIENNPQPERWQNFPFLQRYFGGVRNLVSRSLNKPEYPHKEYEREASTSTSARHDRAFTERQSNNVPWSMEFDPYPNYYSQEYIFEYGPSNECFVDANETVRIPKVHAYDGVPQGFPDAVIGSADLLGIRNDICFDRYGRYGPYGFGYSLRSGGIGAGLNGDREGAEHVWEETGEIDFNHIHWAEVQQRCYAKNRERFKRTPKVREEGFQFGDWPASALKVRASDQSFEKGDNSKGDASPAAFAPAPITYSSRAIHKKLLSRTAIIIRTWSDYDYTAETILYLRSLIAESALNSGGEYVVHFLIHVRDYNAAIWADETIYDAYLRHALPEEFHGMGTLWSEQQMGLIYDGVAEDGNTIRPVHGVYRGLFMPLQYFAHKHPEYDYFWHQEMDMRYTGNWYHFFDRLSSWSKEQPRKGLWERSGRFYVPSEHGSWENFTQMVRLQSETGVDDEKPVWGPVLGVEDLETKYDQVPPTSYEQDKSEWGAGEEADLITLNPLFDPDGTTWRLQVDVTGYNTANGLPPRRSAIITASRLSRRLLETMHRESAFKGRSMFAEMWPASVALQHGLKAVYAPHPVFMDRDWPTSYLASVFNGGRNGASGGAETSIYGQGEHNARGITWFYEAMFPEVLYKRWFGLRINNNEGEETKMSGEGRMCLPAILVHPIRRVDLNIN